MKANPFVKFAIWILRKNKVGIILNMQIDKTAINPLAKKSYIIDSNIGININVPCDRITLAEWQKQREGTIAHIDRGVYPIIDEERK